MANVTVNRPTPPATFTLELSAEEAEALFRVLSTVATSGKIGGGSYQIFKALAQTQEFGVKPSEPYVQNGLVRFVDDGGLTRPSSKW